MQDVRFTKFVIFVNAGVPFALLGWDALHRNLGANPIEFALRTTGSLALIFLILSLAVTPIRKAAGFPWMGKFRKMVGLYGFFYASLHLITFICIDKAFDMRAVVNETIKRPFITLGMIAFILLVPLAITSTTKMVKRIGGKRWNRLHRLVYVSAILGVIHYYMLVKADTREPIAFGVVLAILLAYRIANKYFPSATSRTPPRRPQPSRA